MTQNKIEHCGYVAIIGRPNVGKSTLLNRILGQKISITSHKPQTTRNQILGIKTTPDTQTIFVDTPGLHRKAKHAMNRYMNRAASQALEMVDVVVFMVEGLHWTDEDDWILAKLKKISQPIILLINKVDEIKEKAALLPHIQLLNEKAKFAAVLPISAKKGSNINELEETIQNLLPANPALFPEDQITDRNERFLASEVIREKITRNLHKELPYAVTVQIEEFKIVENILRITALIWVEREGQKKILIGEKGAGLKKIGTLSRLEMEKMFEQKIFLQLWVKVKENWSDDERALREFGL